MYLAKTYFSDKYKCLTIHVQENPNSFIVLSTATCPPGQIIEADKRCHKCPKDSYSDVDRPRSTTMCQPCGEGMGTNIDGATKDMCQSLYSSTLNSMIYLSITL